MEEKRLFSRCQRELFLLLGDRYTPILMQDRDLLALTESPLIPGTPDYAYLLEFPGGSSMRIAVEVKRKLRSAMIPLLQRQKDRLLSKGQYHQLIIFTDRVSQGMHDLLRSSEIWFIDEAGNGYLEIQGKLLINVAGKKPRRTPSMKGQYYSARGSGVLLYLLEHGPQIEATYHDIQASVKVSLGKISQVMTELLDAEVLAKQAQGRYLVINPNRLLDMWASAFIEKTLPKISLGRYRSPYGSDFESMLGDQEGSEILDIVSLGGEYAADLLTRNLRASSLTLYLRQDRESVIREAFMLAPATDGEVILCEEIAIGFDAPLQGLPFKLAAPPVIYAELLATDDPRCGETASMIRERWLQWTQ